MNLENETFTGITDAELEFMRGKEAEAERLRHWNEINLDQFTMKYITDEQKYLKDELKRQKNAVYDEIEEKEAILSKAVELDERLKRDLDRVWVEIDILKEKEKETWRLAEIVEGRRELLIDKKHELEDLKKKFNYLDTPEALFRKQRSFIGWDIDGNSGDIDFEIQQKNNVWLSNYYLDSRLKYGYLCMKVMAILQISCEKDSSEGFIEFVSEVYSEFLKSPTTCSHAAVEHLTPLIEQILEKSEKKLCMQLFPWLILDTGIGAFLPFKEVSEYVDQLLASKTMTGAEGLVSFIMDQSYWFLHDQIITNIKRYHGFLARLSEEIDFKRKPKQFNANPTQIKTFTNINEVQKRLARALASQDSEALTGSVQPQTNPVHIVNPISKQSIKPAHSRSAQILFRITHGSGQKSEFSENKGNVSYSRELSTSVTHHSSKKYQERDPKNDISQHTFKVLINQYHQSIRGRRIELT